MKLKVVTDQDYLKVLLPLLDKAKKSIDIIAFSFAIGSSQGKIATNGSPYLIAVKLAELKKKLGSKIKIRLILEGHRETVERNSVTGRYLEDRGIEVRYGATHAKGFLVDNRYVYFGSTNLTEQSIRKNHEANLLIDDQNAALQFSKYFQHHWKGGEHGGVHLDKPFLPDGEFKDKLIEMVDRAQTRIDFSIYFFSHREIEEALIDAHERGIRVRGFVHQHRAFAMPYIWANRATVKRMRSSGIKELYLGRPTLFSHSKYLVTDGKEVLLGTGNWLQEDVHIHPQLYFFGKSVSAAKALIKHLEHQVSSVLSSLHETRQ